MEELVKENSEEKNMERHEENAEKEVERTEKQPTEKSAEKKFEKAKEKPKKVKKTLEDMGEKKRRKWIIPAIIAIVIIIGLFLSTIFALVNINNEKIISGVSVSGIDISGLSKEEANAKIKTIYQEKLEKEITLKYEEYETTLNPTLMEVNYEVEKSVEEAYKIGKSDNIFINNYQILFTLIGKKNIDTNMTLNEDIAKQTIQDIGVNLPGVILESSYAREENQLVITKGKAGITIQTDELLKKVKDNLKKIHGTEEYIAIPVMQKEPEPINIDKIHEEIYTEAKDAYYTKSPFTVYPEVEGVDFDVEAAREILKEEKEEYIIPLIITKPKITIDQIGSEAFPDRLSTFTTRYDVSDRDRTTNLIIACQKINGKVLLSGETFSYNKTLGARTASAGYKNGKVYEGGEVVDGIGGGICQISSTLYNTALMANLQIVERRNHQFVTSYVPAGRDATVVYGAIDFKFKNNREYPIKITCSVSNGIANFKIFGLKSENDYEVQITSRITGTTSNAIYSEAYKTLKKNGNVVSTERISKDTYKRH